MTTIANQLHTVQAQIAAAAQHAGRAPDSVRLLAVSKTFSASAVRTAALAGQRDFGENYIQEGVEKIQALKAMPDVPALTWHCIGPIQSNKTRLVAEHFDWVHTIDRFKIAQRLSQQRPEHLRPLQVCIQVNVDAGPTKAGCLPSEAAQLAQQVVQLPRLQLRGVMSIPDPLADASAMLAVHRQVVAVFENLRQISGLATLDTISLGMTADLDSAIAAGSTMVRVGSGIFGTRDRSHTTSQRK